MAALAALTCDLLSQKSNHFRSLPPDVFKRYAEKIRAIDGTDPYCLKDEDWCSETENLPDIGYRDVINYLVFGKSAYSEEDFKAYKGLEAFNQFSSGWVREVRSKQFGQNILVTGKVLHSQKTKEPPLKPWIIASCSGVIISAHCDCMAGLGEACTHVSAVLFFIEAVTQLKRSKTVTQVPAYWVPPCLKEIPFARLRDINFAPAKRLCVDSTESVSTKPPQESRPRPTIPGQTEGEFHDFLQKLHESGQKSAILSLVAPFSNTYSTGEVDTHLNLHSLFSDKNVTLNLEELVELGKSVHLTVTEKEADTIEKKTQKQARSREWFKFRSGRITASNFKAACRTKSATSAPSLVKTICYPKQCRFKSKATEWGCSHEKVALQSYKSKMETHHTNLQITNSGFVISTTYPFLGATPDAMVSCDCCGQGTVEIKCPYSLKDSGVLEMGNKSVSFLQANENGHLQLDEDHSYYYQIQMQMFVACVSYCDLVVWSPSSEPYIERLKRNERFLEEEIPKATVFFKHAILPELLGKFFTRECKNQSQTPPSKEKDNGNWCVCKSDKGGKMIECSKEGCSILWYHMKCLAMKRAPKGKWFCPKCKV